MKDCLSQETLELLATRSLRGRERVAALRHLETCAECRAKVRLPTKEEILKRLEEDEDAGGSSPSSSPDSPSSGGTQNPVFKKLVEKLRDKARFIDTEDSSTF